MNTVDYPDVAVGTDRTANALERIATALERQAVVEEQKFLAQMPSEHAAFNAANPPTTNAAGRELQPWDLPPSPAGVAVAQPYQAPVATTTIHTPAPWQCPVHHTVKVVPAGISKRTGASYDAFLSCTERDCQQKPPR